METNRLILYLSSDDKQSKSRFQSKVAPYSSQIEEQAAACWKWSLEEIRCGSGSKINIFYDYGNRFQQTVTSMYAHNLTSVSSLKCVVVFGI
jgi:hypothetical protein